MSDERIMLRVKTPSGEVRDAPAAISVDERQNYTLLATLPELGLRRTVARDQFECLMRLREVLEPLGYLTLVNGARRDVWPSGMARQTSGAREAYLLVLGEHGTRPTVVDIFEPADERMVALVAEQRAFFECWIAEIPCV